MNQLGADKGALLNVFGAALCKSTLRLINEGDHCGEVIAGYKESETLEMPHTDFETENYHEAFHDRDVIRLSLTRKLK